MARIFKRTENTLEYVAGTQGTIQLSRNNHVQFYTCRLKVKAKADTAKLLSNLKLLRTIQNVVLVANGDNYLKSVPAVKFGIDNLLIGGKAFTGLKQIETTSTDLECFFVIPLNTPNAVMPQDTILNTKLFSTLDLNVTWAEVGALGEGITIENAELTVSSTSLVDYARNAGVPISFYKESALSQEITSTTDELTISMPVEKLYRGFAICTRNNNIYQDGILKNVIIKSGETVIINYKADFIRFENEGNYRIQEDAELEGIYYINFLDRGRMTDLLNTVSPNGFNTLEIVLNIEKPTSGETYLDIFSDTVNITNIIETPIKR